VRKDIIPSPLITHLECCTSWTAGYLASLRRLLPARRLEVAALGGIVFFPAVGPHPDLGGRAGDGGVPGNSLQQSLHNRPLLGAPVEAEASDF